MSSRQAEVPAELEAKALGCGEVPTSPKRGPEVVDAVEVVADQLVDAGALIAVDRDRGVGHGAPPLGRSTEGRRDASPKHFGE